MLIKQICFLALRKQARLLENEIDLKLVAFSKIGAGSSSTSMGHSSNADTSPLLGEHVFDSLSEEITQMLDKVVEKTNFKTNFCNVYVLCAWVCLFLVLAFIYQ